MQTCGNIVRQLAAACKIRQRDASRQLGFIALCAVTMVRLRWSSFQMACRPATIRKILSVFKCLATIRDFLETKEAVAESLIPIQRLDGIMPNIPMSPDLIRALPTVGKGVAAIGAAIPFTGIVKRMLGPAADELAEM